MLWLTETHQRLNPPDEVSVQAPPNLNGERLEELIERVAAPPKARRATKPTRASVTRRLEGKARRASVKAGRGRVGE